MFIGEGPGADEDEMGMPFVGKNIAFSFLHKNSKRALPLRSRPPREMPIICS